MEVFSLAKLGGGLTNVLELPDDDQGLLALECLAITARASIEIPRFQFHQPQGDIVLQLRPASLGDKIEPSAETAPNTSRLAPFFAQVIGIMAVFALLLTGLVWCRVGSLELVWPWLQGQRLVFLPPEVQCGVVSPGDIIERQVRVVNLSTRPLTLTGSQQSCGCVTLNEFPVVIEPGKDRRLDLRVGVSGAPGPFEQAIKIFSNDRGSSAVVVKVTAFD